MNFLTPTVLCSTREKDVISNVKNKKKYSKSLQTVIVNFLEKIKSNIHLRIDI